MLTYLYRDISGKEIGPIELDTLAKLRFAGVLNGDTPVRRADSSEWKPCREWIADQPAAAPAPPPAVPSQPVAPLLTPKLAVLIFIGALIYGGVMLYKSVAAKTAVTYDFLLDDKSLPPGRSPMVKIDGQWLESGSHIKPGKHLISVSMNNVEPFEQRFWVIYGTKNLEKLPLDTCKGSLSVTVMPMPATVSVQQAGQIIKEGDAPLKLDKLTAGVYQLAIKHGNYGENHEVEVKRQQTTDSKIQLNLGNVSLASVPSDADYVINGEYGRHWEGKLPATIADMPAGNYVVKVSRQGWELSSDIAVTVAGIATNVTKFPYASLSISSEPSGLTISSGGNTLGKTPLALRMKPGNYDLTASDGENDLTENVKLGSDEVTEKAFIFHYGTLKLASLPTGVNVLRQGKIIGVTPLTLDRVVTGGLALELEHAGYESTNIMVATSDGKTTELVIKLVNSRYVKAMRLAQGALDKSQFSESKNYIAEALEVEPNDAAALAFRDEITKSAAKAEEAIKAAQATANAQILRSLPWLDFLQVIRDCTDKTQVRRPVEFNDGYYDNNGKFHITGHHTDWQTSTESTFNPLRFTEKYAGRTMGFNCPGQWAVSKVEQDGSVTFKGTALFDKIVATPPINNPNAFQSLQKGQKVTIKAVASRIERRFLNTTIYLENGGIITQ